MDKGQKIWYWKNFFYLVICSVTAAVSIDWIKAFLLGNGGFIWFLVGLAGFFGGGYGMIRFIYQYDKARGRVKKNIRLFE